MESLSKLKNKIDVEKILEKGSQAKNMMRNLVMNYSETEAKVMDATNNEPWGASSTLMQEIAKLTYQFEDFEEVMSTIYKRFVESGEIWRQIYKALNLLEYLIKNGSDKVVDYAKNHIYEIKSLMTYQHVDDKGKDQGLNVRNRAKEIILLLNSNDRIREEREKAKANRDKYIGVSSESRYSGNSSNSRSSSKYDDFEDRSDRYSRRDEYEDDYQPQSRSAKSSQSQYESPAKSSSSTSFNQHNDDDDFGEMNQAPVSKTTEAVRGLQFTQNPESVNFNNSYVPAIQKPQQSPVQQPKQQTFQQQSKQDDFGDFADFSGSSFSSSTSTITPTNTTTTSSLTGFADFNAFQTPQTFQTPSHTSQQQKQQNLDPFGDPFGSVPLDNNSGLLQPESKNKKTTTSIATPTSNTTGGGSDKFGFSGLVDLDNLKKYDSGKKEQKSAAPMGQIKSTTTTTTSTSTSFSSPMGGSMNGGMGSGMNQPMYGGNMNSGNMYGNMNSGMGQPMYGNMNGGMNSGMNQPMYGGMNGGMNGNMNQGMNQPMYGNMRPMGQQQQQQFFSQQSTQPW